MRTISRLVVTVVSLGAMTGCGAYKNMTTSDFAKQEPEAIVAAASKAMLEVTSMRLTGQVRSQGNEIFIDLSVAQDHLCRGTMRIGGSHVEIRRIGDQAWLRGDSSAVATRGSAPGVTARAARSKWVPATDRALLELCDLRTQLEEFTVTDPAEGGGSGGGKGGGKGRGKGGGKGGGKAGRTDDLETYVPTTVGEETSLDGVTVVPLSGRPGGEHEETSWVRTDAPHYVVRIESTSANNGGTIYYSAFNDEVVVEAPDRKDILRP